ncbi:L,D-transpeptidase [Methylocystis sp. JAN1]|uniref:L,D-transpeptidase n=1 Tax=Methylocystis sp. JAN1 TaxID=3397211 RepID=UPI003FA327B5
MKTFRLFFIAAGLFASASAQATVRISIDLSSQRLTATRGGETVVWKISSGRPGYETPTGHYSVMRMEADHHSDEYEQAPMPYAIFFSPRGLAIHGTFERGLGNPRSHGCVRLSISNAQKLYEWVEQQGATIDIVGGTRVAGRGSRDESAGAERAERRRAARRGQPIELEYPAYAPEQAFRFY